MRACPSTSAASVLMSTPMRRTRSSCCARAARAQRAARRNGIVYQLGGPGAFLRTLALTAIGGERLLARYDWLYGWRPG